MTSRWSRSLRNLLLAAAGIVIAAIGYFGARNLARLDPFAKYKEAYLSPFGGGIGSQMNNVDATIYERGVLRAKFHATQVQVRKDQQFFRMSLISDGIAYEGGKEAAFFEAGLASYDAAKKEMEVAGAPRVRSEDFDVTGGTIVINQDKKTVSTIDAARGKYEKGEFTAATFELNYETQNAVMTKVAWKGEVEVGQGAGAQKRNLDIRSERWEHYSNPRRNVYFDAEAIDQDALIRAEKITWDVDTDIVTAEGNCEYHGPDAIFTAPKVVIYRKEKRAVATGDVKALIKPEKDKGSATSVAQIPPAEPQLPPGVKPPAKKEEQDPKDPRNAETARKYPIVITCTNVEYFYTEGMKKAVMTGSPKARQELPEKAWREITAPTVIYEEDKELMTMLSNAGSKDVRMKNNLGDDLLAEMLVISTKEGDERITGTRIEGVMKIDETKPPPTGGGGQ